jgi:F420-dependent oxidoreductase-like protein
MIEVAIMIEGQNGLNWENWKRMALAVEDLGFSGLFRSDHFTNAKPPDLDSLELWTSLTWLASHTMRIGFGPLVSPVSFRHPTMTARMAAAVDDLSGGRLTLGLGAGWQEREHNNYGYELLDIRERFKRFEEGLEIISLLLGKDTPSNFDGSYYRMRDGILLPRPKSKSGPSILIGGNGPKRTLPLVAKYANEWNSVYLNIPKFSSLNNQLNDLLSENGRKTEDIRRSLMIGCVYGHDEADLARKVADRTKGKRTPKQLIDDDFPAGTPNQLVATLERWAEAGISRIMLQWLDLNDLDGLEGLAHKVLPQLGNKFNFSPEPAG